MTEQKAENDPTMSGIAWKMLSVFSMVGHCALVNSHARSLDHFCVSNEPISVLASCDRTSDDIANSSVRFTSDGSENHGSALK